MGRQRRRSWPTRPIKPNLTTPKLSIDDGNSINCRVIRRQLKLFFLFFRFSLAFLLELFSRVHISHFRSVRDSVGIFWDSFIVSKGDHPLARLLPAFTTLPPPPSFRQLTVRRALLFCFPLLLLLLLLLLPPPPLPPLFLSSPRFWRHKMHCGVFLPPPPTSPRLPQSVINRFLVKDGVFKSIICPDYQ